MPFRASGGTDSFGAAVFWYNGTMKNSIHLVTAFAALACVAAPVDRAFLTELVSIPSESAKTERVNEAMAFTRAYLEKRGVPCVTERDGSRDILYASTRPGKVQDYMLCVHLDVVPAPDAKMYEPRIDGDRLYARGASDDKGNASVAVQVLVDLLGKASVGVIFTADEELGGMTTATMVARGYAARRFAIVIDSSPYKVTYAQKGTSYIKVRAVGKGGHSSQPWKRVNPIDKLVDAYAKFRAAWPKPTEDHWCDIVSATIISAGEARNRIPDTAEMTINLRFVSKDGVERTCKALKDVGLEIAEVVTTGAPVSSDPSAPEIQRLLAAMRAKWPERKPSLDKMLAATDARHFVDMGVPIAIIGAEGGGAHAAVEWINLRCLDEYADLLEHFILDAPTL